MNKVWNTYISRVALTFTLAVIFIVLFHLITGNTEENDIFLLESLGCITVLEIIDYLLTKFSFKSRLSYLVFEFIIMYACFLAFSFFGHWFTFSSMWLLLFSFIFLVLFLLLHLYYHFVLQSEADAINKKLINRKLK